MCTIHILKLIVNDAMRIYWRTMSCGAGDEYPTEIEKGTKWARITAFENATLSPAPHQRFVMVSF